MENAPLNPYAPIAHADSPGVSETYQELRRIAAVRMQAEPNQTIQPTALVHEAWLKLQDSNRPFHSRDHFLASASQAMRQILVDRARRRLAKKHGGHLESVEYEDNLIISEAPDDELIAVNDALTELESIDPAKAELVKLRYFTGFTMEKVAELKGISLATANRHWAFARAWLKERIENSRQPGDTK